MLILMSINVETIVMLTISIVSIIGFILYSLISNILTRRSIISKHGTLQKKEYLLTLDNVNKRIKLFKNYGKEELFSYTFSDAYALIDFKDIKRFDDWYVQVKVDPRPNDLVIKITEPFHSTNKLMRLSLLSYNKETDIVYSKLVEVINNPRYAIDNKSFKMLDLTSFNEMIKQGTDDILGIRGLLVILKIEGLSTFRRRYGIDLSNLYLMEIWKRVNKLVNNHTIVTYLNSSQFALFRKGISESKQAITALEELIKTINMDPIVLDKYPISPTFKAGMTLFGEYTYDLKIAIKNATQALEKPNHRFANFRFGLYDYSFEKENILFAQESEQIAQIINSNDISFLFAPYVYLLQTSLVGYHVIPHTSLLNNKDYNWNLAMASNIGMRNEYLKMVYTTMLNKCYTNSKKRYRLYIQIDIAHLPLFTSIIEENDSFKKLRIYLVFNYPDLLNIKNNQFKENISKLQQMNVTFATFSDETMLTITSKLLAEIETIIFTPTMIQGIESNDLEYMKIVHIIDSMNNLNMRYMAYGATKYEQADLLQKAGINVVAGDFIALPIVNVENTEFLKNRHLQSLHGE